MVSWFEFSIKVRLGIKRTVAMLGTASIGSDKRAPMVNEVAAICQAVVDRSRYRRRPVNRIVASAGVERGDDPVSSASTVVTRSLEASDPGAEMPSRVIM